jgi:hypothetical protein
MKTTDIMESDMKFVYRVMWKDHRQTRDPVASNIFQFIEAYSVVEALQIASYEYGVGTAYNVPILEVKIDEIITVGPNKEEI